MVRTCVAGYYMEIDFMYERILNAKQGINKKKNHVLYI